MLYLRLTDGGWAYERNPYDHRALLCLRVTHLRAMEVLARHAARLGPAGHSLEKVVQQVVLLGAQNNAFWQFLEDAHGQEAYQRLRRRFERIHASYANNRKWQADKEICRTFRTEAADGRLVRLSGSRPPSSSASDGHIGVMELHIMQVRFSHDDQSERFGGGIVEYEERSVLQTAIELAAGLTKVSALPRIRVCWHEGHWYCRTGNRRLAALHLAHGIAPEHVSHFTVEAVATDQAFTHGVHGKRPKLTTARNGGHCRGKWMYIKETDEAIGNVERDRKYGLDLLQLLAIECSDALSN